MLLSKISRKMVFSDLSNNLLQLLISIMISQFRRILVVIGDFFICNLVNLQKLFAVFSIVFIAVFDDWVDIVFEVPSSESETSLPHVKFPVKLYVV